MKQSSVQRSTHHIPAQLSQFTYVKVNHGLPQQAAPILYELITQLENGLIERYSQTN